MEIGEKIFLRDQNGNEKEYSVLATFEYKEKKFVIYTSYDIDDGGKLKIYSAISSKDGESEKFENLKDIEDIKIADEFIKELEAKIKNGEEL